MNSEELKDRVKDDLGQMLEAHGIKADISEHHVEKLNASYEALSITPEGSHIGVNANLSAICDAIEDGQSYSEVVARTADSIIAGIENTPEINVEDLTNYDEMKTILGSVSCGLPQLEEENAEEYLSLPVALFGSGSFYLLRAKGTSMIEAGINPGDLVLIREQSEAKDGEIIVALVNNENTLKRLRVDEANHCVRLHPENKKMQDIIVPEGESLQIQGVAVHVIKALV